MLFVVLLLVVPPLSAAAATDPPPTIDYEDPESGHAFRCTLCPPGTRMTAPCTRSMPTECAPCPEGYYTRYWNYLHRCLPCRAPCDHNQQEQHECAPTTDRECECAPGHYWRADQCKRHTRCGPGFGIKRNGTTYVDTACARCPRGTFSEGNSAYAQCRPHTGCKDNLFRVFRGTSWYNDVCVSCTQLKNGGDAALLRSILPTFFAQKLKNGKLRQFVRALETQKRQMRSASSRRDMLNHLHDWTKRAQDQQFQKLPKMLERLHLHNIAKKLRNMLREFQNASNCTKTDIENLG